MPRGVRRPWGCLFSLLLRDADFVVSHRVRWSGKQAGGQSREPGGERGPGGQRAQPGGRHPRQQRPGRPSPSLSSCRGCRCHPAGRPGERPRWAVPGPPSGCGPGGRGRPVRLGRAGGRRGRRPGRRPRAMEPQPAAVLDVRRAVRGAMPAGLLPHLLRPLRPAQTARRQDRLSAVWVRISPCGCPPAPRGAHALSPQPFHLLSPFDCLYFPYIIRMTVQISSSIISAKRSVDLRVPGTARPGRARYCSSRRFQSSRNLPRFSSLIP